LGLKHLDAKALGLFAKLRGKHGPLHSFGKAGNVFQEFRGSHLTAEGGTLDHQGGDAFAGGFLSGLLAGEDAAGALERGVVSASFALEAWGAAGLIAATPAQARQRRAEWFGPGKDA